MIRHTLRFRSARENAFVGDRGSIPMALLVAIVGFGLAALMVPMMVTQLSSTTFTVTRGHSLHAAQSGLEMAVGQIRAATTDGAGDRAKLPCGPLSGAVADESATDDGSFSVTIQYFYAGDPSTHDATWQKDHAMLCVAGAGPYDPPSGSGTPSFALLTATGTGPNGDRNRVLQSTYVVKTTNRNIAGGAIPLFPATGSAAHYCLDAGSPLAAGNAVGVKPCPAEHTRIPDRQKWAYNTDLTLQLTATIGDVTVNPAGTGLCLDTQSATHAVGTLLVVKPCATVASGANQGKAIWRQVWSINSNGHFEGSKSDFSNLDGFCLFASGQPAVQLSLDASCYSSTIDWQRAWNPMPSVGAGQAGETNGQLVNFAQFGRCIDVTNQSVATGDNGGTFLILYPCKQNPNVTRLDWNQLWKSVPIGDGSTVQWRTYVSGNTGSAYCLTSPLADGQYVYASACSSKSSPNSNQVWAPAAQFDSDGNQLPYAQKYTIKDSSGLCLAPGTDEYYGNAKVVVASCTGKAGQKWNADPDVADSSVVRLHEVTGSAG